MKKIKFGTGFAVFVLFFGIALVEAIGNRSWLTMLFWLAMGGVFLLTDNMSWRKKRIDGN